MFENWRQKSDLTPLPQNQPSHPTDLLAKPLTPSATEMYKILKNWKISEDCRPGEDMLENYVVPRR
jgi:hypothetical protein